jgi:hypothetical protein
MRDLTDDPDLALANAQFVRGDAAAFKDLWSHREDVTILGPSAGTRRAGLL